MKRSAANQSLSQRHLLATFSFLFIFYRSLHSIDLRDEMINYQVWDRDCTRHCRARWKRNRIRATRANRPIRPASGGYRTARSRTRISRWTIRSACCQMETVRSRRWAEQPPMIRRDAGQSAPTCWPHSAAAIASSPRRSTNLNNQKFIIQLNIQNNLSINHKFHYFNNLNYIF